MKTKFLYVVISTIDDVYFEQVWVSAWSLKKYNSSAAITILTDCETLNTINNTLRKNALSLFDEIVEHKFEHGVSNKVRSRWLKTNMRNLVKGDFLFLDSDTLVQDSLSEIDNFKCNIGMVLDLNRKLTNDRHSSFIKKRHIEVFGVEYNPNVDYYNSGVIYAKDNSENREFFNQWFENWKFSTEKNGLILDQPSLAKTNIDLGGVIESIGGEYNCQILSSIEYIYSAKIFHFFNVVKK